MRNQRAGQATFIPLDTIQVKPINDKFRSFAKGARLGVDVIQYEPVMERAIHHACGNALVCDTMEVARYVCYEKGQEEKIPANAPGHHEQPAELTLASSSRKSNCRLLGSAASA